MPINVTNFEIVHLEPLSNKQQRKNFIYVILDGMNVFFCMNELLT